MLAVYHQHSNLWQLIRPLAEQQYSRTCLCQDTGVWRQHALHAGRSAKCVPRQQKVDHHQLAGRPTELQVEKSGRPHKPGRRAVGGVTELTCTCLNRALVVRTGSLPPPSEAATSLLAVSPGVAAGGGWVSAADEAGGSSMRLKLVSEAGRPGIAAARACMKACGTAERAGAG